MATIEAYHATVLKKIAAAEAVAAIAPADIARAIAAEIACAETAYRTAAVRTLSLHYLNVRGGNDTLASSLLRELRTVVVDLRLVDRLDGIIERIIAAAPQRGRAELTVCARAYGEIAVEMPAAGVHKFDRCPCGAVMNIQTATSEITCGICGTTVTLRGTIFADSIGVDAPRRRSSGDVVRHCQFWIDCLQGRDSFDDPAKRSAFEQCLIDVRRVVSRDRRERQRLNCDTIRAYLKETDHTKYNAYVPLIREKLCGVPAPQLTLSEERRLLRYMVDSFSVLEAFKENSKNNKYYPYFMYKCLEIMLAHDRIRLRGFLECIHVQSDRTIKKNDILWRNVCMCVPEFDRLYYPTCRQT